MGIRGSARLTFGDEDEPQRIEKKGKVLTSSNIISLAIDSLCDQDRRKNATVECFYFDFAPRKERLSTGILGALLKQAVGGLAEAPGQIVNAYEDQKVVISRRAPRLSDIVKMLQTISPEKAYIHVH